MTDRSIRESDSKVDEDATGAYDYFTLCIKATFEFGESKEERLRTKYTISAILTNSMNRDMLVKMMIDD